MKEKNRVIEDHGSFLQIDVSTKSCPGCVMLVDRADWERYFNNPQNGKVIAHLTVDNRYPYAEFHQGRHPAKQIRFHRLIFPQFKTIDHINRNGLDNRRSNLRDGGGGINSWNRATPENNQSGYVGVSFVGRTRKWRAYITVNHKQIHLGYFDDKEEANRVRTEAKEKYHKI